MSDRRRDEVPKRRNNRLSDYAIILMILGLMAAGISVVFPFYAHSRIAGLGFTTREPTLDELVFLSNLLTYGTIAVASFLSLFVVGLLILLPSSWRRSIYMAFGALALIGGSLLVANTLPLSRILPGAEVVSKGEVLITMKNQIILGTVSPSYVEVMIPFNNTVRWRNDPSSLHSDVIVSEDGLFRSPILLPGETWAYTFEEPGTYRYYSPIHPWMRGAVAVRQPQFLGEES